MSFTYVISRLARYDVAWQGGRGVATLGAPEAHTSGGIDLSALGPLRRVCELWHHIVRLRRGQQVAYLDSAVDPIPRYGWGRPSHSGLERLLCEGRCRYASLLERLEPFSPALRSISVEPSADPTQPHWINGYIGDLDAATLYAFPKLFGSRRYLEVGSGNSTKFVRRSIEDHALDTRIVSIDPQPRTEIDALCDEVIRAPLEATPPETFDRLEANDVLMIDGSHRCLQNSDVTVTFLEVLPRLASGVLVFIHDVYLPHDYPPEWSGRYYSEQYLLAVLLLTDRQRYEIILPCYYSFLDPELRAVTDRFWRDEVRAPGLRRVTPNGFWMRVGG